MCEPGSFVGVAFLRGDPRSMWDRVVMGATRGPFVHTEFFIQRGADVRMYTAVNLLSNGTARPSGFMPSTRLRTLPEPSHWEIVKFPVSPGGYTLTYAIILQLLAMNLPYNARDLWQCCVKLALPFERDLDCNHPETWRPSGVFCSQACLLLLRRLQQQGVLALRPASALAVHTVNSRGCSPNSLFRMLCL